MQLKNKQEKIIFARLFDWGGDMEKQWFVFFSAYNPWTKQIERKKIYKGFSKRKTKEERIKYAKQIIAQVNFKLRACWNPWAKDKKYTDALQYASVKQHRVKKADYSIYQFLNQYLEQRKSRIRYKTSLDYATKFRIFNIWLEKKQYEDLPAIYFLQKDALEFMKWLQTERKLSNNTYNGYVVSLRSFFQKMLRDGIININPFENLERLPTIPKPKLPFKLAQRETLKEYIPKHQPQLWTFLQFMFYTFIRPGELRNLKVIHLDVDQGNILIPGEFSKNKKSEYVKMPEPFKQFIIEKKLYAYPEHYYVFGKDGEPGIKPVSVNHFCNQHRKILRDLKFSADYSLYSWKHTAAVSCVNQGLNLKDIQVQIRHSSLDMLDNYLKSIGAVNNENIRLHYPML